MIFVILPQSILEHSVQAGDKCYLVISRNVYMISRLKCNRRNSLLVITVKLGGISFRTCRGSFDVLLLIFLFPNHFRNTGRHTHSHIRRIVFKMHLLKFIDTFSQLRAWQKKKKRTSATYQIIRLILILLSCKNNGAACSLSSPLN